MHLQPPAKWDNPGMTCTVIVQVCDKLGTAAWWWTGTLGGRHLQEVRSHPAASFDDDQPAHIPITLRHDGERLGQVAYLEHGIANPDLTAIAVLDCDPEAIDGLYASAEITATMPHGTTIATRSRLDAIAVVGQTAGVAARAIRAYPGDFRSRYDRERWPWNTRSLFDRAAASSPNEHRSTTTGLRINRPPRLEHRTNDRPYVRPAPRYATPYGPIEWSAPYPGIISVT